MKRRTCQPALPLAAVTAAMLLSLSASADASLIASLMQTGQPTVSIQSGREGITNWFNRLTDAAHGFQNALSGEHDINWDVIAANVVSHSRWSHLAPTASRACDDSLRVASPIQENLTNLPPPTA